MANDIRPTPAPVRSTAPPRTTPKPAAQAPAPKETPKPDRATVSAEAREKPTQPAPGVQALNTGLQRNFSAVSKDRKPELSVDQTIDLHKKDPVAGNQAVTDRYYHEAQQLNQMLGGDENNFMATWPAYGAQASNSAGAFIRDDGVPVFDSIQRHVAEGNRMVFQDIAPHFDAYIETFSKNPKANFDDWMKTQDFNGKPDLAESFRFLERARTTDDPDKKQEYLLASNALAGYHEQTKLQGPINDATAPVTGSDLEHQILERFANEDPKLYLPTGQGSGDMQAIDTSQKIQPFAGGIPPALQSIDDPGVRKALQHALENPNADVSSGQAILNNTGTSDWSKLPDRMRTITGLMVAGQNSQQMGGYPLDYNPPPAPSTTGHAGSVLESTWTTITDIFG